MKLLRAFALTLALLSCANSVSAQVVTNAPPRPGFRPGIANLCTPVTYAASPYYQSLAFTDSWATADSTLSTNSISSPACVITGARITENGANSDHSITKLPTGGGTYGNGVKVATYYARRTVGVRNTRLALGNSGFTSFTDIFANLADCSLVSTSAGGSWTTSSGVVTPAGGLWCKIVLTVTWTGGSDSNINAFLFMTDASNNDTYTGDGTSQIAVWGLDIR